MAVDRKNRGPVRKSLATEKVRRDRIDVDHETDIIEDKNVVNEENEGIGKGEEEGRRVRDTEAKMI